MNSILNKFFYWLVYLTLSIFIGCSDNDSDKDTTSIVISEFSPLTALPGDKLTITGSGFSEDASVYFNDTEATEYVSRTGNSIEVIIPFNASTGRIGILSKDEYAFSKESFTLIPGAEIQSISPLSGTVGETVSILGFNFHSVGMENISVYFNNVKAVVVMATAERIDAIVPEGASTGPVLVVFGDIQRVTGPEFVVGEKEPDPFEYYFTHKDVEEISGACNPCSYADENWSVLIGERDKTKAEYVFKYSTGYDDNSAIGSFVLWDSASGNHAIFKVNILEADDYYIYFGRKGKGTGDIIISAGADKNELGDGIAHEVSSNGYTSWGDPVEYGLYSLPMGINYIRIDFEVGLALNDIHITNIREIE